MLYLTFMRVNLLMNQVKNILYIYGCNCYDEQNFSKKSFDLIIKWLRIIMIILLI